MCPGNNPAKQRKIRSILDIDDWKKLKLAHLEQGFWLSHAGLDQRYFGPDHELYSEELVYNRCQSALVAADVNVVDPILLPDRSRGGYAPPGGILWQDWEWFTPIPGVDQIVGHSPNWFIRYDNIGGSSNACIDTNNRHYALIEDGFVTYHEAPK